MGGGSFLFDTLKRVALVSVGTLIIAFGSAVFIIPSGLVTGGVSGAAIIIERALSGAVGVDLIIAVLSWGTFLLGLLVLGGGFATKTLVSTVLYPPLVSFFMRLASPEVLSGYFYLAGAEGSELAQLIAAVLGGALMGVGCALAFLGGGSTGGVDILALIVTRLFRRIKSSQAMLIIDGAIVILGAFVFKSLVFTTLGVISALVSSFMLDRVFLFEREALTLEIISDEWLLIKREIIERFHRTATVFSAVGGYTGKKRWVIRVTVSMREYPELVGSILNIDPSAFVTAHRAHEICGEGWEKETP